MFVCQSVCMPVCLSVRLSVCQSALLFVCLSFCLCICLSMYVCLSVYLSMCLSVCSTACVQCYVQLNVKLFVFDKRTQSWLERGLGLLRLNDRCLSSDSFQSRLGLSTLHTRLSCYLTVFLLIQREEYCPLHVNLSRLCHFEPVRLDGPLS